MDSDNCDEDVAQVSIIHLTEGKVVNLEHLNRLLHAELPGDSLQLSSKSSGHLMTQC